MLKLAEVDRIPRATSPVNSLAFRSAEPEGKSERSEPNVQHHNYSS